MSKKPSGKGHQDHAQSDWSMTLQELLDSKQPYEKLDYLKDPLVELNPDGCGDEKLQRIQGSLVGLAIGDALGASVEFRPHAYLQEYKVTDMQGGGTWGLSAGEWTDDTSMALCLAASLIVKRESNPYDQFVRYKRWYREGYMSSTGKCFDIGKSTREAITRFEDNQNKIRTQILGKQSKIDEKELDHMIEDKMRQSKERFRFATAGSAGNGSLMRIAPIPCFFWRSYDEVKKYVDETTEMTHDDIRARDACRFYAGLIWYALDGRPKKELLSPDFYRATLGLQLHPEIQAIAEGSYKNKPRGYEDGIRGKGFVVDALEAALWAFHKDEDQFDTGVLLAVNLGDDTDTTAAIYGQLAGACYKVDTINKKWRDRLFKEEFIMMVAKGLYGKSDGSESRSKQSGPTGANIDPHEKNRDKRTEQDQHPKVATAFSSSPNVKSADQSHKDKQAKSNNNQDRDNAKNPNNSSEHPEHEPYIFSESSW